MKRVVLGLSGGVDSAVAAALLKERYEVHCVYLDIGLGGGGDAEALARSLDLPFRRVDVSHLLERHVCAPFAADYLAGRTPIPCARCNPTVKFPALAAVADKLGGAYIATGHYARVSDLDGRAILLKGRPANDQSYMLARLPQELLQRVIFPLGDYEKAGVRALAEEKNLSVAHKADSMEICFIPDNDYAGWLARRGEVPPPGDFVDRAGKVLGRHGGIHRYTIGQGKGLGVSGPHRYYVTALCPAENRVVLSDGSDLMADLVYCDQPNWIAIPNLTGPMEVTVRLRHSRTETPALIRPHESGVVVEATEPVRAPTPGQLAVFYLGDAVIGSAWISSARRISG